jgi:hypothetical protein
MKPDDIDLASLDLYVDGDPHADWKLLREQAPVHWNRHKNMGFWSIRKARHLDVPHSTPAVTTA